MTSTTCICHARSTTNSLDTGTPREQYSSKSIQFINWFYPGFICQCWCGLSWLPTWAELPLLLAGGSSALPQRCLQLWLMLLLPVRLTMAVQRVGGTSLTLSISSHVFRFNDPPSRSCAQLSWLMFKMNICKCLSVIIMYPLFTWSVCLHSCAYLYKLQI